ncbi:hypothetical protein QWZ02_14835 [Kinneretia asaccharophila]|uniref:Uncharacterized protein n=1 Tax=Roseateles asaccharophilus TaxID=582607 RepID=A0A4R6MZ15_9BURK|nr:hypothetical protein [Roseateles asaccharophilus]MDN3545729.1 hypothetical protein [Roseateles asaccharophilus]TDP07597.1 hypothetical protein DFR39_107130 [Roseateles asaccharophilus]
MTAPSLDARAIASHVLAIERGLDLDSPDWRVGDVHLWPLYRLELYRMLFVCHAGPPSKGVRRPEIGPVFRRTESSSPAADADSPVWLVSDGISFAALGDDQMERFCGPLHQALRDIGVDSVLVDRGSPQRRRGTTPTRWWMPLTHRAKLSGALRAAFLPDRRHQRLVEQVRLAAGRSGIVLPPLSAKRFNAMTNAVLSLASTLAVRMRRERVRAVFVVGYYDVGGYAYVLAAHRAGAASIDVQHGVTGDLHMAYADWHVEPAGGLALLPRFFWCWADDDARVVERWVGSHALATRQAFVGGHPFLEAWRTGSIRLSEDAQQALDRLRISAEGRPPVLVTLQPHLTTEESLAPLLQAWIQQPKVAWWLRLHPLATDDRAGIEALLASHGVTHWNITDATSLPLPVLLRDTAAHATHSSSTVIEAELLGIPSLVWSDYGEQLFEAHIRRGVAIRVSDGDSFVRTLPQRCDIAHHSISASEPSRLTGVLQTILQAAQ